MFNKNIKTTRSIKDIEGLIKCFETTLEGKNPNFVGVLSTVESGLTKLKRELRAAKIRDKKNGNRKLSKRN